jgi:hypothetical protein
MAALCNGSKCIAHPAFSGTSLFHRFTLPILGISQSSTCFWLNPYLIFEIGSKNFFLPNFLACLVCWNVLDFSACAVWRRFIRLLRIKIYLGHMSKTSKGYVKMQNLTMRMSMRRFKRLTNAFSKKADNLKAAVALHYAHRELINRPVC